jgi:hypothetical protein
MAANSDKRSQGFTPHAWLMSGMLGENPGGQDDRATISRVGRGGCKPRHGGATMGRRDAVSSAGRQADCI